MSTTPPSIPSQRAGDADAADNVVAAALAAGIKHVPNTESVSGSGTFLASQIAPPPTAPSESEQLNIPAETKTKGATPPRGITLKRATKISLHFKSDINLSSQNHDNNAAAENDGTGFDTACSGIVHACRLRRRSHKGGESHAFAWISNVDDAKSASSVVEYLQALGYRSSSMKFTPYSSYQQWITSYPHAIPVVECDIDGNLHVHASLGNMHSTSAAASTAKHGKRKTTMNESTSDMSKMNKKVAKKSKSKPPPKLLTNGCLPNSERDELHCEIHKYFTWLHDELVRLETHATGRRQVSIAGVSVPALRSVVRKLECAFRAVKQSCSNMDEGEGDGGIGGMSESGKMSGMESHPYPSLPFLEHALQSELLRKVNDKLILDSHVAPATSAAATAATIGEGQRELSNASHDVEKKLCWRTLDFDTLYQKLVDFKEETGHASPPMKHPVLGRWVAELRAIKKGLKDREMEFDQPNDNENNVDDVKMPSSIDVMLSEAREDSFKSPSSSVSTRPKTGNTYLTQSRVQRLEAISFPWTVMAARVTWEQRLEELQQFREVEGRFPSNKEGALGNWLKEQRKLYTKNDVDFMINKRPKVCRLCSITCACDYFIRQFSPNTPFSTFTNYSAGTDWSSAEAASLLCVELG